jgi:hypothetical protein
MKLGYTQEDGIGYVRSMDYSFYGGKAHGAGKIYWLSKGSPYSFDLNLKDVKLEKLKKDTDFKDKDVAGDIKVYAKINGLVNDLSKLTATGKVSIANGKLWQLNLFRGLGTLIFTDDFNDIMFTEGSSDFKIKDNAFVTDDLILKSDQLSFSGSVKYGFDRSITALLSPELAEEAMYPGIKKNIAAAIGKSALIEVSGTVTDPKYKVNLSVADLVGEAVTAIANAPN